MGSQEVSVQPSGFFQHAILPHTATSPTSPQRTTSPQQARAEQMQHVNDAILKNYSERITYVRELCSRVGLDIEHLLCRKISSTHNADHNATSHNSIDSNTLNVQVSAWYNLNEKHCRDIQRALTEEKLSVEHQNSSIANIIATSPTIIAWMCATSPPAPLTIQAALLLHARAKNYPR